MSDERPDILRQFRLRLDAGQFANLLAQSVPVETEKLGSLDLITSRGAKRRAYQRHLDLPKDPLVKARRRETAAELAKILRQMTF